MGLFGKFKKSESAQTSGAAKDGGLIRVADILTEKAIAFFPAGPSKRQLFASLLGSLDLPDTGSALKAILAREEAGSTVVTPGFALPHARITGITGIKAALGLCPSGMQYSHAVEDPVRLILLFLGPAENMRQHLAFLAAVSALFQKEDLVKAVLQQTSPKDVLRKIKEAEK